MEFRLLVDLSVIMLTACFPKDADNSISESETEDKSPAV